MWHRIETGHDDVVGIQCRGEISATDIKGIAQALDGQLEKYSDVSLVVVLDDFEGYRSWIALLRDLRTGLNLAGELDRIALAARQGMARWTASILPVISGLELRTFDVEQLTDAINWAAGGDAAPPSAGTGVAV